MNAEPFMHGLTLHHLRFTVEPLESIVFSEQPGTALRGALYQGLSEHFCSEPNGWLTPDHAERCPVCWLLARELSDAYRGKDIPRPLTVEPPLEQVYHRGQAFTFGITLIGRAQNFLPYVARAVQKVGHVGVGKGRGRFRLVEINEYTPLLDASRSLMQRGIVTDTPTLQITPLRVAECAAQGRQDRITLEFRTPLRLIDRDARVTHPDARVLVQRLVERCQSMVQHYAESESPPTREAWKAASDLLVQQANALTIGYNDTRWVDIFSGSQRTRRWTPIGGLVGTVRYEGDVGTLRGWFLWGQSLHVGKDAVKGNGWYRVVQ